MKPNRLFLGVIRVVVLTAACAAAGCVTNTTTGRSQLNVLSEQEEIALGNQAKPQMMKEFGGEVPDAQLRQYVTEVGQKLVATTALDDAKIPQLPWEFTLLNSNVINAFALPGGKVFVSLGLARQMTNEAQLAAVLGHEIGHVTARHINDRYSRQLGASILLGVGGAVAGDDSGALARQGEQLAQIALLSYDRGQELESDALGMRYMVRAQYNPLGARQLMELLVRASSGGRQLEILSTHPHPESRLKKIDEAILGRYAEEVRDARYILGEGPFKTRFLSRLAALPAPSRSDEDAARRLAALAQ